MHIQKARKGFAAPLGIGNTASRPFLLFLGGKAEAASTKVPRECINFAIRPRHAPRRSRVYRGISRRSAQGRTEPHTGERGRVAPRHRSAYYITAAAPDAPVSPRAGPPAALTASPKPVSRPGPAAAPRLAPTPPPARTPLAGPGTAELRCPQRPAVRPGPAARYPPPRRHPWRIPAAARPAAPRRSRCLVPSRPPQLPARLTEGAGSRAAPRRRRSPAAPPPAPARRQGALLAPTYRGDEGPGRRGRRESESPCHEAGLRRAASIGAATAVRSARGCKRTWEPRDAVTRGAARGPRREGVGATGPGRRRGSVRTGAAALR